MRLMRRYLRAHDVNRWARSFLAELGAPEANGLSEPER